MVCRGPRGAELIFESGVTANPGVYRCQICTIWLDRFSFSACRFSSTSRLANNRRTSICCIPAKNFRSLKQKFHGISRRERACVSILIIENIIGNTVALALISDDATSFRVIQFNKFLRVPPLTPLFCSRLWSSPSSLIPYQIICCSLVVLVSKR